MRVRVEKVDVLGWNKYSVSPPPYYLDWFEISYTNAPQFKTTRITSPKTYALSYQARQKMDYSPPGYT